MSASLDLRAGALSWQQTIDTTRTIRAQWPVGTTAPAAVLVVGEDEHPMTASGRTASVDYTADAPARYLDLAIVVDGEPIVVGRVETRDDGTRSPTADVTTAIVHDELVVNIDIIGSGGIGGGSIGGSIDDNGDVVIDVPTTVWGIAAGGEPYFDPDGAAAGEEAVLQFDPATGDPVLIPIGAA